MYNKEGLLDKRKMKETILTGAEAVQAMWKDVCDMSDAELKLSHMEPLATFRRFLSVAQQKEADKKLEEVLRATSSKRSKAQAKISWSSC